MSKQKSEKTNWDRLRKMKDSEIDFSDIAKLNEEFFKNAESKKRTKGRNLSERD